ncbi:MAG: addiction module protein [Thiobacillus sp.]|nr:addiction module protein [Thiobacillus sp.]
MPNLDALTQLPLAERLAAMESLWDSLCQDDAAELSPPWHTAVLEARLRELEAGQHRDWQAAKDALRKLTER